MQDEAQQKQLDLRFTLPKKTLTLWLLLFWLPISLHFRRIYVQTNELD
jgi:hypothetical protein